MAPDMGDASVVYTMVSQSAVSREPSYFASAVCPHPVLSANPMLAAVIHVSNFSMPWCK